MNFGKLSIASNWLKHANTESQFVDLLDRSSEQKFYSSHFRVGHSFSIPLKTEKLSEDPEEIVLKYMTDLVSEHGVTGLKRMYAYYEAAERDPTLARLLEAQKMLLAIYATRRYYAKISSSPSTSKDPSDKYKITRPQNTSRTVSWSQFAKDYVAPFESGIKAEKAFAVESNGTISAGVIQFNADSAAKKDTIDTTSPLGRVLKEYGNKELLGKFDEYAKAESLLREKKLSKKDFRTAVKALPEVECFRALYEAAAATDQMKAVQHRHFMNQYYNPAKKAADGLMKILGHKGDAPPSLVVATTDTLIQGGLYDRGKSKGVITRTIERFANDKQQSGSKQPPSLDEIFKAFVDAREQRGVDLFQNDSYVLLAIRLRCAGLRNLGANASPYDGRWGDDGRISPQEAEMLKPKKEKKK